jgi:protein-S-isoprenylcysteine O-methyltransferase Ste14
MNQILELNTYALVAGTVFIIAFSWFLSIKHGRYHGIARFFAFESVFILVMLNLKVWFNNPFSLMQLVSWILLTSSLYFAIYGFILLRKLGKPQGGNFENTSVIVKIGLYKYIRHPLYLSIFLAGTGVMLKGTGSLQLILGAVNLIAIWFTARIEEGEMIAKFGGAYRDYMKETKMFIPFVL